MAQQNLGITIVVALLSGLIGGFIGGLLAPIVVGGMILGAAATAVEEVQEEVDLAARTRADMRTIGIGCEAYAVDNARYPDADSIVSLAVRIEPTYVSKVPYEDSWGSRYVIASGGREYEIRSSGPDGISHNGDDLVYSNGEFTKYE